jgi:hypothetical protein
VEIAVALLAGLDDDDDDFGRRHDHATSDYHRGDDDIDRCELYLWPVKLYLELFVHQD